MNVKIIVAGSYHASILAKVLVEAGHAVTIISSTPPRYWRRDGFKGRLVYIPLVFQLIRKVFGRRQFSWQKHIDSIIFDFIASFFVMNGDIVYGFAGCSLNSGRRAIKVGGRYILDRACPHFEYQENLLKKEYAKLKIDFYGSGYFRKKMLQEEYLLAEKIVVPSKYTAETFNFYHELLNKIIIINIPPKLNFETIKNKQTKIGDNNDKVIIGIIGADLVRKGYFYLLESWRLLNIKNINAKLVIKGPKQQFLKSKVISQLMNNLSGVVYDGFYLDINEFYKKIDILVLPSIDEGFGMVVLEAMANSVPVIVSDHVGASDYVREAKSGIVVNAAETSGLEAALTTLIKDNELRKELGKNGAAFIRNQYDINYYKTNILKVLVG